jgi:cell division initiation protein
LKQGGRGETVDAEDSVTPDEIRHVQLPRRLRGYDSAQVDRLLEELAADFAELLRERNEFRERADRQERELEEHREVQHLMREALVSAQRAADELKDRTEKECDELRASARAEAEETEARAKKEEERVESEVSRLKTQERELRASYRVLLHAALDRLEEEPPEEPEAPAGPRPTLLDALAPRRILEERPGEEPAEAVEGERESESESPEPAA